MSFSQHSVKKKVTKEKTISISISYTISIYIIRIFFGRMIRPFLARIIYIYHTYISYIYIIRTISTRIIYIYHIYVSYICIIYIYHRNFVLPPFFSLDLRNNIVQNYRRIQLMLRTKPDVILISRLINPR